MPSIAGQCKTNLDDYDCSIVKIFAAIPNKGDSVSVLYKGKDATLKVVGITHRVKNTPYLSTPYIEVELNK